MNLPDTLTFAEVDDIAFAAERGRLNSTPYPTPLAPAGLGPLLELTHLARAGGMPTPQAALWISTGWAGPLLTALSAGRKDWYCPDTQSIGFLRTRGTLPTDEAVFSKFGLAAQKAACAVGVPKQTAAQLVGAIGEMHSNIYEHSGASETGLVAFRVDRTSFEWVVADHGIGVRASLAMHADYAELPDEGAALRAALSDGASRFGMGSGRGMGFRPLFVGLANLRAQLRFRSGDHALTIDGITPSILSARTSQKAKLRGLFAAVVCVPPRDGV
jgi:anti-sigma regulatory factor (Ser/Thr protein kinase)